MTARKAQESDLGHAIRPSANGDGQEPVLEIGPQIFEPRVTSPFPPIAEYAFLSDCEVNWLIVRDAMCIGPWYHSQRRSGTYRRPPTDYEAEHILLRTARCVVGQVELSLDCQPVFDYGQTDAKWEYAGTGYNEAIASGGENEVPIRLVSDLRMGFEGPGAHATKILRQGERAYVAMVWPRSRHSTAKEYW